MHFERKSPKIRGLVGVERAIKGQKKRGKIRKGHFGTIKRKKKEKKQLTNRDVSDIILICGEYLRCDVPSKSVKEVKKMKPVGRSLKPFTEKDLAMIKEYLETDKSLKEVSAKYGISDAGLRYKVKKYRKEQEERGKEEDN